MVSRGAGTVVFLGPTMPLDLAKEVLPDARFLPPVAQGDIWSLLGPGQPDAIGIIDGVFFQDLPVWHKEIILAMEKGLAVYGSSSMGALRAAECRPFGMVGVGAIYEGYASGELIDDDEVAVAHDGPEHGWRPRTEPVVNIRATLQRGVAEGRVEDATATRALQVAKGIWFAERTRVAFLAAFSDAGARPDEVGSVQAAFEGSYVDQKRVDAEALLHVLERRAPGQDRAETRAAASQVFLAFLERDRKVAHQDETLRLEEIARYAALHETGFAALRDRALDRLLVNELACTFGVEATEEENAEEARRIRLRLGLLEDAALERWLTANDVGTEWLDRVSRREALARRLRDWAQVRRGNRLLVEPVLDELRLSGRYEQVVSATGTAAQLRDELDPHLGWSQPEEGPEGSGARVEELVRDQIRSGGWRPDVPPARFAEEAGFADVRDLLDELAIAKAVRARARSQLRVLETLFGSENED